MSQAKHMPIKEFREAGYLQEANRLFFHPLGLHLRVVPMDHDTEVVACVHDYRDSDEGILYEDGILDELARAKALRIGAERAKRAKVLHERYGFTVQPFVKKAEADEPSCLQPGVGSRR